MSIQHDSSYRWRTTSGRVRGTRSFPSISRTDFRAAFGGGVLLTDEGRGGKAQESKGPGASVDTIFEGQRTPSRAKTRSSVDAVPAGSPIRQFLAQRAAA